MNINDIRDLNPCYDPSHYLPEDWEGTAIDILRVTSCPADDRLWVVLRPGWVDERTARLFAVWCAREALKLVDDPDPRSTNACDVAERYANGKATDEELAAAQAAAWDAAQAAAQDAAQAAARDAVRSAAWDAQAAWFTARDAQAAHLLEMLDETGK